MKVYIISLMCLFIGFSSYAQRVTLNELLNIQESNPVDVEDTLYRKGFVNEPSKVGKFDGYGFRKFGSSSTEYMNITKDTFKGKNVKTSFYTLKVADYIKIKDDLKANNFIFIDSEKPDDNTHIHNYKKGNILVNLEVHYLPDVKLNSYFIMVTNIENEDYYFRNKDR